MAKRRDIVIGILIVASFLFVLLIFLLGFWGISADNTTIGLSGEKIGIVEIEGIILSSQSTVEKIVRMRDTDAIKAIVLRINSPGGGVAASQEIYQAVKSVQEEKKPIVVSMASVAASGGYYISCAADSILANPGTTTGSIGVIMEIPNFEGLMKKIGIRMNVIKSGKFKDTGSPYRSMRDDERRYLQEYINDAYNQFVNIVADNRNMSTAKVKSFADGRIFTGQQALEIGLIDRIGDFREAIDVAAKMAGIAGKPETYQFPKRKFTIFDLLFSDMNKIRQYLEAVPSLKYQFKLETL